MLSIFAAFTQCQGMYRMRCRDTTRSAVFTP